MFLLYLLFYLFILLNKDPSNNRILKLYTNYIAFILEKEYYIKTSVCIWKNKENDLSVLCGVSGFFGFVLFCIIDKCVRANGTNTAALKWYYFAAWNVLNSRNMLYIFSCGGVFCYSLLTMLSSVSVSYSNY